MVWLYPSCILCFTVSILLIRGLLVHVLYNFFNYNKIYPFLKKNKVQWHVGLFVVKISSFCITNYFNGTFSYGFLQHKQSWRGRQGCPKYIWSVFFGTMYVQASFYFIIYIFFHFWHFTLNIMVVGHTIVSNVILWFPGYADLSEWRTWSLHPWPYCTSCRLSYTISFARVIVDSISYMLLFRFWGTTLESG